MKTREEILQMVENEDVEFIRLQFTDMFGTLKNVAVTATQLQYELDMQPIEPGCQCPVCRRYSRAYIRHLLKAKEMLGMRLCVMHNLYFYNTMMTEIRDALDKGEFAAYKKRKLDGMQRIVYDGK